MMAMQGEPADATPVNSKAIPAWHHCRASGSRLWSAFGVRVWFGVWGFVFGVRGSLLDGTFLDPATCSFPSLTQNRFLMLEWHCLALIIPREIRCAYDVGQWPRGLSPWQH